MGNLSQAWGWGEQMSVQGIHHVSLIVADTNTALDFYQGLLGLEQLARPELGYPGAWLAIGPQQLHLLELPNPDPQKDRPGHVGRDRHLALAVHDLDALLAKLEAAGLTCMRSRSGRAAVFCRDPDGNGVELVQV
jgi:glyoxylase I family protein